MFDELAAAVESLEIPCDGRALTEALGLLDRLTARVAAAVGAFDRAGGWADEGSASMHQWLKGRGLDGAQAGQLLRVARWVAALPRLREAWDAGDVPGGVVRAVAFNVSEPRIPLFASQEDEVVPALARLSVDDAAAAMRAWSAWADDLEDGSRSGDEAPRRAVYLSMGFQGRYRLDGDLDSEGGAVVAEALRAADSGDKAVEPAQRRADALVDVARFFLGHRRSESGRRNRPHLTVVVDWDALLSGRGGEVEGGARVDGATVERLLCDSTLSRLVTRGDSTVLDHGRSTPVIPRRLWQAMAERDRRCRFPGCDRPVSWCEGHHVVPFSRGGVTALDNLVALCGRHHRLLHGDSGFAAELLADGVFRVTMPDGTVRVSRPPPRKPPPGGPGRGGGSGGVGSRGSSPSGGGDDGRGGTGRSVRPLGRRRPVRRRRSGQPGAGAARPPPPGG